jgi:hypothetical protein
VTDAPEPHSEAASRLEEPRLRFFLENQDQIREWALLATEVQDAVADTLRDLRLDLVASEGVAERGLLVSQQIEGETATGPVLFRPTWRLTSQDLPDVGVALGWDGRLDPSGLWPRTTLPYVGVNASHATEPGKAIEGSLRKTLSTSPPTGFQRGSHWVVFRNLRSKATWWEDLAGWRSWLVLTYVETWDLVAPLIDQAVSDASRASDRRMASE